MFSWIFKKKNATASATAHTPSAAQRAAAQAAESAQQAKQAKEAAQQAAASDWSERIRAAQGDDNTLLTLAKDAPSIDLKLAAVQALTQEASLKLAEREFRTHDRRVHQLAKQRHASVKLQRETTTRADELLQVGQELLDHTEIPVNRLAELDRHWHALDATLTSPTHQAAFKALSASLTAQLHAQTEHRATIKRWTGQARQAIAQLDAAGRGPVTEGPTGDALMQARDAAAQVLADMPADDSLLALQANVQSALTRSASIPIAPLVVPPAEAPLPPAPPEVHQARPKNKPARIDPELAAEQRAAIDQHLSHAEAALAEGQIAQAHQHLAALDAFTNPLDAAQRSRAGLMQAEIARLKGWQQWGGGLARDELVLEAEALAKTTATAAEAGQPIPQIQAHAKTIDELRQRWRDLDRLKAASSQTLWERFDAALQAAYLPVAAHLAQLEAERQVNLASRQTLLDALESAPLPDATEDWKDVIRSLDQFQSAWRKLGPAQHTTPRKAQKALFQRLDAALARLEGPLHAARQIAQTQREALVARAQAIGSTAHGGEAVMQVRELQAQWQQHARTLPLTRATETALWADFKAATDAVFQQREAAFKARDAALDANEAARIALIERLQALDTDTSLADLKRTLAETDTAWRQAGDVSRAHAAALDAKWRAARAHAQALIADHAQRLWHRTCDALLDKLALCEAQEAGDSVDVEGRWNALPPLPPLWERALSQRKTAAQASATLSSFGDAETADAALLQLESLLNLPSPADQSEARRELKLLTMKATLEGRPIPGRPSQANKTADELTAELLGTPKLNEAQRQRLHQLITGLRAQPPQQGFSARSPSR